MPPLNATLADGNNTYTATTKDTYDRTPSDTINLSLPSTINFSYGYNGNLTNDGRRVFEYDYENQLTNVYVASAWRSEFKYDSFGRRRTRKEFTWQSSNWVKTNEVRYVYDGNLVMQERDVNNLPTVTYTRGKDLSGSVEGAGGIGGLLARTDMPSTISAQPSTAFYHCDGNGNVTCLINTNQIIVAKYLYDPFGNTLSASGPLAEANLYRFSSKELHQNSGLVYYLYRHYAANLQRWVNRDPWGEVVGINLYTFLSNDPILKTDAFGLSDDAGCDRARLILAYANATQNIGLAAQATVLINMLCNPPPPPPPVRFPSLPRNFPECNPFNRNWTDPWNSSVNSPAFTPPGWRPEPTIIVGGIIIVGGVVIIGGILSPVNGPLPP